MSLRQSRLLVYLSFWQQHIHSMLVCLKACVTRQSFLLMLHYKPGNPYLFKLTLIGGRVGFKRVCAHV